MKQNSVLVISSFLTMLLTTFHLAEDIVRGFSPGRLSNVFVVLVVTIWLYATLLLAERRSGYVIILVMSILSSGIPVIHMTGKRGIAAGIPLPAGAFFFVWTLIALGVTAALSAVLSVRGLWSLQRQHSLNALRAKS